MKTAKRLLLGAAVAGLLLSAGACTNPETPAGHEGYVYHVPLVWGKMEYRETLVGPASTGLSWRLFVKNIDMRARSYAENFNLLTRDNLSIAFEVNTRLQLRSGTSREVVEDWGGTDWYEWNVKEPLRTRVRRRVTEVSATEIQVATEQVRDRIRKDLEKRFEGTPIEILSVDIGHIEFPEEVMSAIQDKISAQQEYQRQQFVLAKTKKEAAIRVLEALRVANQQQIISATLDPLYVQRKAVQVYKHLAEGPNETVVVLPNTPEGTGLPKVLTRGERKTLSDSDRALLEDMEERYMQIAEMDLEEFVDDPEEIPESFEEGSLGGALEGEAGGEVPELPEPDPADLAGDGPGGDEAESAGDAEAPTEGEGEAGGDADAAE